MKKAKILVIGETGFIGSKLMKKLKSKKYKPFGFSRKFDILVHLAAKLPDSRSEAYEYFMINCMGLLNALEFARRNKVKIVIFTSSASVYSPDTPYGLSKLTGEMWCRLYSKMYGMEIWAIRAHTLYGGKKSRSVVTKFIKQKLEGQKLTIYGDGRQTRYFVHVNDVVDAIYKIIELRSGKKMSINEVAKLIKNAQKKKLRELLK